MKDVPTHEGDRKYMPESTFLGRSKRVKLNAWRQWQKALMGVRSRLLIWYFLLTLCITLSSVWATFKIFCASEEQHASVRLQRDINALQQQIDRTNPNALTTAALVETIDKFTSSQVPDPYESLVLVTNGQVHSSQNAKLPSVLQDNPDLMRQWAQPHSNRSFVRENYIIRVVEPLPTNGENAIVMGLYDATLRYQMGNKTLDLVIEVTLAMMGLFMAIAWLTAGRILSPLRQLTDTAKLISETDLSQRMNVRGTDEIAELTLTFNQMLDRLQAAFTSQQDFIKDVSHELRTPITIIQGHLELLGDDPEDRAATVALVRDELKRMNRFVTDLLLLMRSERPNFLRLSAVELEPFTQELFAKARGMAARDWQLEAIGSGEIVGDRQRLTQIVMNLAQNATQYTHRGETIAIGSAIVTSGINWPKRPTYA
ncbi:histidine kinase dimerization/phospho-acceptor domain-containing protein [Chamaesiphon polymorphus]|uniref:histidine kinase dimerization/phospho-acceptor domain-containing protein n=1 Tax=Chamaesiphon polymorphus TaxID=2107691 RepID=UPI001C62E856|nr:histidine kinase dimerization/phospho-acceptor domain-containing protein [Chamaesiphon polymorphus]